MYGLYVSPWRFRKCLEFISSWLGSTLIPLKVAPLMCSHATFPGHPRWAGSQGHCNNRFLASGNASDDSVVGGHVGLTKGLQVFSRHLANDLAFGSPTENMTWMKWSQSQTIWEYLGGNGNLQLKLKALERLVRFSHRCCFMLAFEIVFRSTNWKWICAKDMQILTAKVAMIHG